MLNGQIQEKNHISKEIYVKMKAKIEKQVGKINSSAELVKRLYK